jgi:hypothetical protein
MQKYYHKGVFYMDKDSLKADDVRLKDGADARGQLQQGGLSIGSVINDSTGGFWCVI